jgi:site-specific DNA-cytosine methylase
MKILELFAGSRSIGKIAERMGFEVLSSDINDFQNISYVKNILEFNPNDIDFIPDVIWASPPCTAFSVASLGHHWGGGGQRFFSKDRKR